jgi:hypothetical protein
MGETGMSFIEDLNAAEVAYYHLLRIPATETVRHTHCQPALAFLRDYIASKTGIDAEKVQNAFEADVTPSAEPVLVKVGEIGLRFERKS